MSAKTGIEWTDATWNPVRGCSRVSEGCRNCYAEKVANRFGGTDQPYDGLTDQHGRWNGRIRFVEEHLLDPLRWQKPRRIFVNSMSDLFHENVTDAMRDQVFAVMALASHHTFQILTKRPERMLAYMTAACTEEGGLRIGRAAAGFFRGMSLKDKRLSMAEQAAVSNKFEWKELANVQLGVSVENQAAADARIPLLLQTPAAVRFISAEPLLGALDLAGIPNPGFAEGQRWHHALEGYSWETQGGDYYDVCGGGPRLDWVICGGESGPGARPMHPEWARSLRDQCVAAGVPFFFKQWGQWAPKQALAAEPEGATGHGLIYLDGATELHEGVSQADPEFGLTCWDLDGNNDAAAVYRVGKHAAGSQLDGVEWKQFPAVAG